MTKKVLGILLIIVVILSTKNYVLAKYIKEQYIHIAEVNIEKTPIKKKKYVLKVYYKDLDANSSMKVRISSVYEGNTYEAEVLEFEGYTYLYADQPLSGIMEKNLNIYICYKKNK